MVPIRRVWTKKPPVHAQKLDYSNPILRDVTYVHAFDGRDRIINLVDGVISLIETTGAGDFGGKKVGLYGEATSCNEVSTGTDLSVFREARIQTGPTEFSIMSLCWGEEEPKSTSANDLGDIGGPFNNGGQGTIGWHHSVASFRGSFQIHDGAWRVADFQVNKSISAKTWHSLVGTLSQANSRVRAYLDGDLSAETATGGGALASAVDPGHLGNEVSGNGWNGRVSLTVRWKRELSAKEIQSLYDNPWQIFQPRTIWFPIGIPADGLSGNLGLITETDSTFALGKRKDKVIGLLTEADLAQALGKAKAKTISLISESDLAQAIGKSKALAVGLVSETDLAQALGRAKQKVIGLISEIDQVFAISTGGPTVNLGLVLETDVAQAISSAKRRGLGLASELDVSFSLGKTKVKTLGLLAELDLPLAIAVERRLNIGLVLETDSVFVMSGAKALSLGLVSETDQALAMTSPSFVVVINLVQRDARFQVKLRRDGEFTQILKRDSKFAQAVKRDVEF